MELEQYSTNKKFSNLNYEDIIVKYSLLILIAPSEGIQSWVQSLQLIYLTALLHSKNNRYSKNK